MSVICAALRIGERRRAPTSAPSAARRSPLEPASDAEERKVVTCLFSDLVGFTARAERDRPGGRAPRSSSPTTSGSAPSSSASAARSRSSSATRSWRVFGAPVAHEDDPERAVRAALAIRDWARGGGRARGADRDHHGRGARRARTPGPRRGEGDGRGRRRQHRRAAPDRRAGERDPRRRDDLPGDRARDRVRATADADRREGQGGADRRLGGAARSRLGVDVDQRRRQRRSSAASGSSTLVERRSTRARREREPQLVTLVGVPGIGKSRLVLELFQRVEAGAGARLRGGRAGRFRTARA